MRLEAPTPVVAALALGTLLLCGSSPALAEDVVYVFGSRGGAIEPLRGTILKYEPGGSLHFRTTDGEELVFSRGEVANVVRNATPGNRVGVRTDPKRYERRRIPVSFQAWIGYGAQSLSDVNRVIEEDEVLLQSLGGDVELDRFGSTPEFGGAVSFVPTRGLSVGVEVGFQTSTNTIDYADDAFSVSNVLDLRIVDVVGAVQYRLPMMNLLVGATAGVGLGNAAQRNEYRDLVNPANDEDQTSDWDGSGFVGGAWLGYETALSHQTSLFLRSGYRSRNLGRFEGQTSSSLQGEGPTEPVDNDGDRIEFDFSGPYVRLGLMYVIGG